MFRTGRSREGAWIEIATCGYRRACCEVAPVRERGLKLIVATQRIISRLVAPVRERGLKCIEDSEGAEQDVVAPVRERGLKCYHWKSNR